MGRRPIWETDKQRDYLIDAKEEICFALQRLQVRNQWTQKQMAALIGTSQSSMSKATRVTTARQMSFNRLFRYLARAEPRFRVMISI